MTVLEQCKKVYNFAKENAPDALEVIGKAFDLEDFIEEESVFKFKDIKNKYYRFIVFHRTTNAVTGEVKDTYDGEYYMPVKDRNCIADILQTINEEDYIMCSFIVKDGKIRKEHILNIEELQKTLDSL